MPKRRVNELHDVDVEAVSIVDKGANRQIFFMRKGAADKAATGELLELPGGGQLVKAADWSAVYCVVAEPGALEEAGLAGDNSIPDRWASEDEIRKAAHRFMKNGGLVNRMHESLAPYGAVVENAVALDDFKVNGRTIRKGSWYIAIEPSDEGREKIEAGEFTGVSIQGSGIRKLVEKAGYDESKHTRSRGRFASKGEQAQQQTAALKNQVAGLLSDMGFSGDLVSMLQQLADKRSKSKGGSGKGRGGSKKGEHRGGARRGSKHASPGKGKDRGEGGGGGKGAGGGKDGKGGQDSKGGGLQGALHDLGLSGSTDQMLGALKRQLLGLKKRADDAIEEGAGDVLDALMKVEVATKPGTANVSASDRKKLRALAEHYLGMAKPFTACTRDQVKHGLSEDHAKKRCAVLLDSFDPERKRHSVRKGSDADLGNVGAVRKALKKMGERLGLTEEDLAELDEDLLKGQPTFAERMAQRDLDEELPDAMNVLRSVIWQAFYPPMDAADGEDPRDVISTSLDEFKEWALELLDRVPVAKLAEQVEEDVKKMRASDGDLDTVDLVADEKNLTERLDSLDERLDKLPDAIAKAIKGEGDEGDGQDADEVTLDTLAKRVDEVAESVGKITKALGKGGSTQPADTGGNGTGDRDEIAKNWKPTQAPKGIL